MGENVFVIIQRNFSNTCNKPYFYILEIPLSKTAKLKLNINGGTLHMEVDQVTLIFNIFKIMKYSTDDDFILFIDTINFLMQDVFKLDSKDELDIKLDVYNSKKSYMQIRESKELNFEIVRIIIVVQPSLPIQRSLKKFEKLCISPSPINWVPLRLIFDIG